MFRKPFLYIIYIYIIYIYIIYIYIYIYISELYCCFLPAVTSKPTKDLKLVKLMPYVKELSSEGTVIAGWLDQAEDWDQIQQLGLQISVELILIHSFPTL